MRVFRCRELGHNHSLPEDQLWHRHIRQIEHKLGRKATPDDLIIRAVCGEVADICRQKKEKMYRLSSTLEVLEAPELCGDIFKELASVFEFDASYVVEAVAHFRALFALEGEYFFAETMAFDLYHVMYGEACDEWDPVVYVRAYRVLLALEKNEQEEAHRIRCEKAEQEECLRRRERADRGIRYYTLLDGIGMGAELDPDHIAEAEARLIAVLADSGTAYSHSRQCCEDLVQVMLAKGFNDPEWPIERYERAMKLVSELRETEDERFRRVQVRAHSSAEPHLPRGERIASARGRNETVEERDVRKRNRERNLLERRERDAALTDHLKEVGGRHGQTNPRSKKKAGGKH